MDRGLIVRAKVFFIVGLLGTLGAARTASAQAPPAPAPAATTQVGPGGVAVAQAVVIQRALFLDWYAAQVANQPAAPPPAPTAGFAPVAPSPFRQEPVFYGTTQPAQVGQSGQLGGFGPQPLPPPVFPAAPVGAAPAPALEPSPGVPASSAVSPAPASADLAAPASAPDDVAPPAATQPAGGFWHEEPADTAPARTSRRSPNSPPGATAEADDLEEPAPQREAPPVPSSGASSSPYAAVALFAYVALVLGYGAYAFAARRVSVRR